MTGARGFLGRELLAALLANPEERVVTPLRPSRGESAAPRISRGLVLSQRADRVLRPLLGLVLIGRLRRVHHLSAVYVPYLSKRLVFDNATRGRRTPAAP